MQSLIIAILALLVVTVPPVLGDFDRCRAEEWRPVLKKAYIQQKGLPSPRNLSQKRVLEEELPKPYRILGPFSPYTRYRTHKRMTVYVDKNGIVEDVECS
ncbi:hypothetical protein EV178_001435 [Coemansia sp. RSA 1646]|nr:hypothetical protein EV178_001435 [Coemansia sp. RSA 1646]KAJ1766861.1 hypothetical protein LPJ74_005664 [Coemansia sp. RSA 1843]KAJ2217196.1 hypothetical protein EV179_000663 [Coemansia sp. RSA 487]